MNARQGPGAAAPAPASQETRVTMRRWAVVLVSAAVLGGCASRGARAGGAEAGGGADAVAAYYPLAVGNRWTYEEAATKARRDVVVEREQDGVFFDNQGGQLSVDGYGLRDQRRYLLRAPLEAGKGWSSVASVSAIERYRVVEAGAPCETKAGRFERCVVVEGSMRADPRSALVVQWTFARDVGIVRLRTFRETADGTGAPASRALQTEAQLVDYALAPGAKERPGGGAAGRAPALRVEVTRPAL